MATKLAKSTKTSVAHKRPLSTRSGTVPVQPVIGAPLDITTRDADGRTPLHVAAFHGYSVMARKMLLQQAEVDARDNGQRTPGHWSAFKGNLEVMNMLLEFGADLNARDTEGRTLLRMAIIGQQSALEAFLRAHGAVL